MATPRDIETLIKQYADGKISSAGFAELFQSVRQEENTQQLYEAMDAVWKDIRNENSHTESEREAFYHRLIADPRFKAGQHKTHRLGITRYAAMVAAAVALIVLGVYFFTTTFEEKKDQTQMVQNDVAPGHKGATLTLANGKKIRLSDAAKGRLAKEAGAEISKSEDGQLIYEISGSDAGQEKSGKINTLTTAKGETYQLRLPDGTLVWLNAASSLSYPANFDGDLTRHVKLEGEGYFEVSKDRKHPFIVETRRQTVEVLGTHFNISAYANDEQAKTTLLEGSVAVTAEGSSLTLHPGDQAYSGLDGIRARTLSDPDAEVDWKNGDFVFNNESLEQIMKKVARWYDIEVSYETGIDKQQLFGGKVSRNKNISAVLNSMHSTGKIKFKVQGREVTVIK